MLGSAGLFTAVVAGVMTLSAASFSASEHLPVLPGGGTIAIQQQAPLPAPADSARAHPYHYPIHDDAAHAGHD